MKTKLIIVLFPIVDLLYIYRYAQFLISYFYSSSLRIFYRCMQQFNNI